MESSKKRVQRVNKRGISLDQLFMNAKKAEDEKIVRELEAAKEKLKKTFIKGNFYMITERSSPKDKTVFGASLNNFYIFEFIEKQGIHHTFKEIHGGWTRTYTDAQLVDKKITEVNRNSGS